jgi:HEAT repeat protein
MGVKSGLEALVDALRDPEWQVRQQVVESLGALQDKRATQALVGALQDSDWRVRLLAAQTLGPRREIISWELPN